MKFLHIMKNSQFSDNISYFLDQEFGKGEHEILYFNEYKDFKSREYNISIPHQEMYYRTTTDIGAFKQIIKLMRRYDHVVLHSLFIPYMLQMIICLNKRILNSLVWIEWGFDLYSFDEKSNRSFAKKIFEKIVDTRIRTKCCAVVCIFPPDLDCYRKRFPNSQSKVFYAPYTSSKKGNRNKIYSIKYDNTNMKSKLCDNQVINIIIGHQANPLLNHMLVLDWLSRFKDRNINVYLPLSYGDTQNAIQVEEHAKKLFGDKAIVIRDFMPLDSYMDLLKNMDIAIFHIDRQIGTGNINPLIHMKKKVYLKSSGVMYQYFHDSGVNVQNSDELSDITFDKLTEDINMDYGPLFIQETVLNSEKSVELWKKIFEEISK